ncbi:hypothetical protein [Hungatella hathewayi]|uniref:hypothetical protein n=1 Tax=Hungatella hathewayi TaxID=154046 RepID=UPI0011DC7D08|nr:hypothetical protein [Hungatella hathewayi]
MKKALTILLFLTMALTFSACGGKDNPTPSGGNNSPTASQAAPSTSQQEPASTPDSAPKSPEELPDALMGTKTLAYFQKYASGGAYTTEMKMEVDGMTSVTLSAYDGGNVYTESEVDGMKSITILKDDAMYVLDPASKICMKMAAQTGEMQDLFADEAENYETAVTTGDIEVNGKSCFYEEFTVEGSSVKYCFDGDDLNYMLMDAEGQEAVIEILRMEAGVDKSLFEIPDDYTMMEY